MRGTFARLFLSGSLLVCNATNAEDLLTIFSLAEQNDQQYRAALANAEAGQQLKGLRSAALKPQVSAYYSYSQSDSDVTSESPFPFDTDNNPATPDELVIISNALETEEKSTNWGVTVEQTLFSASAWQTAKQGKFEASAATLAIEQAKQALMMRVSQAYFAVLSADNNLAVAIAQNEADDWLLKQTQGRYDVGEVAYTDVHQAQAAFDISRTQMLAAEAQVENSRYALSVLTGQSHQAFSIIKEDFYPHSVAPNNHEHWQNQATENSLEVAVARAEMQSSKAAAKSAKFARLPSVSAQFDYFDTNADTSGATFPDYSNTANGSQITLSVSAPLYLGGSLSAQKRSAHANYNASLERYKFALRNSEQRALIAFNNLSVAVSQVLAQQQVLRSATSAADSISAGYEAGINTIIDLVSARRTQFAAKRDLGNAKIEYILNFLELKHSTGNLQISDINNINNLLAP